jgi:hypothetical protein
MAEFKVEGSGGYIIAELTEEQAKKADLGVGKLFLAPIGKLEQKKCSNIIVKTVKLNLTIHQKFNWRKAPMKKWQTI